MLARKPIPAEAQFKHFIYGLMCYHSTMDCPELRGLALPKIRRGKKLPRILSFQQVMHLLGVCDLYSKALLAVIYDLASVLLRHATSSGTTSMQTAGKCLSSRARAGKTAMCLFPRRLLSCSVHTAIDTRV